jgi:hypothetical protein
MVAQSHHYTTNNFSASESLAKHHMLSVPRCYGSNMVIQSSVDSEISYVCLLCSSKARDNFPQIYHWFEVNYCHIIIIRPHSIILGVSHPCIIM